MIHGDMGRVTVNFFVDVGLFALFLCALWTAAVAQLVFPQGASAAGWTLWGIRSETWHLIAFLCLSTFALMVLVHLILHWNWVFGYVTTRIAKRTGRSIRVPEGVKTLYGVGFLIAVLHVLGILLAIAVFAVKAPVEP